MSDSEYQAVKRDFRRKMQLEKFKAVLGNTNGQLQPDPINKPGSYYVQYITSTGMSLPPILRMGSNFVGQTSLGLPVICKYDDNGELVIWGNDVKAQIVKGFNPTYNNPADPTTQKTVDTTDIIALAVHSTSPVSTVIVIRSFVYVRGSIVHLFAASDASSGTAKGRLELSSFIPVAGQWCLVGVFLKPDDTLEAHASTAQSMLEDLDLSDIQECVTAATVGGVPVCCYKLQDAQLTVTDADFYIEMRQYVNIPRYGRTATAINYTMLETDNIVAVTDTSAGRTITLPLANSVTPGWPYVVQDESGGAATHNISLAASGSDNIRGASTISANYGRLTVYSNGSNAWFAA